jgi:hypothetical protein
MTVRDLSSQVKAKQEKLKQLEGMEDHMAYPGGRRGAELEMGFLRSRIDELKKEIDGIKERRAKGPETDELDIDIVVEEEEPLAELGKDEIEAALGSIKAGEITRTYVDKDGAELSETDAAMRMLQELEKDRVRDEERARKETFKDITPDEMAAVLGKIEAGDIRRTYVAKDGRELSDLEISLAELQAIERERVLEEKLAAQEKARMAEETDAAMRMAVETSAEALDKKAAAPAKAPEKTPSGFTKEEEAFFKEGDEISEVHAEGGEVVTEEDIIPEPAPREIADALEKNELSPERREALEGDLRRLEKELYDLQKGAILRIENPVTGERRTETITGLEELEKDLMRYGVDVAAIENAKDDKELEAIFKKQNSFGAKLRRGVKYLLSPGYRRTIDEYRRRIMQVADIETQIAETKLMIADPKKAAELADRRMMRAAAARARMRRQPTTPGSPFSMRFPS